MTTLQDLTGFVHSLTSSVALSESLTERLNKIHLSAKQDESGNTYLVHRDGAYVAASFKEDLAVLISKVGTITINLSSRVAEDDCVRAFRYAWSTR